MELVEHVGVEERNAGWELATGMEYSASTGSQIRRIASPGILRITGLLNLGERSCR